MEPGGQLTESHQFILALIAQVSSVVSMIFLYRSSPKGSSNGGQSPSDNKPS
jgi:hypothetical protein